MNTQNTTATQNQSIKSYLTPELINASRKMTPSEMRELLRSLKDQRYWVAIIKYCLERLSLAQNGLFTLDPFKDQTQMARYQGAIGGLFDLPDAVEMLLATEKEQMAAAEASKTQ